MTLPVSFVSRDAWHGGWYELAVRLGPRSDRRLLAAARWVWSRSDLDGPYGSRDVEPAVQQRADLNLGSIEHLFGVAHIPDWVPTVCSSVVIREEEGMDWFDLGLPLGALAKAEPRVGGYPFQESSGTEAEWMSSLDDWLAEIALGLREIVPFDIALIGYEVSGLDDLLAWSISEGRPTGAYVDSSGYHTSQL